MFFFFLTISVNILRLEWPQYLLRKTQLMILVPEEDTSRPCSIERSINMELRFHVHWFHRIYVAV